MNVYLKALVSLVFGIGASTLSSLFGASILQTVLVGAFVALGTVLVIMVIELSQLLSLQRERRQKSDEFIREQTLQAFLYAYRTEHDSPEMSWDGQSWCRNILLTLVERLYPEAERRQKLAEVANEQPSHWRAIETYLSELGGRAVAIEVEEPAPTGSNRIDYREDDVLPERSPKPERHY